MPRKAVKTPDVTLQLATPDDAEAILELRSRVAEDMIGKFGKSLWGGVGTVKGVLWAMRRGRVYIALDRGDLLGGLTLATRKPWAIDVAYFTPVKTALYLTDMEVRPDLQRKGIGRALIEEARRLAHEWPADAIRLDAFDNAAGAGGFYAKCGFTERGRTVYRKAPLIYYEWLV